MAVGIGSEQHVETKTPRDSTLTADAIDAAAYTATTAPEHDRVHRVLLSGLAAPRRLFSRFDGGPPPAASGAWMWVPHTEAVAEAVAEAAPYELPAWPFAPLAPPATANTRAAAAELIHNIGWPVPPGLFLDAHGSREW